MSGPIKIEVVVGPFDSSAPWGNFHSDAEWDRIIASAVGAALTKTIGNKNLSSTITLSRQSDGIFRLAQPSSFYREWAKPHFKMIWNVDKWLLANTLNRGLNREERIGHEEDEAEINMAITEMTDPDEDAMHAVYGDDKGDGWAGFLNAQYSGMQIEIDKSMFDRFLQIFEHVKNLRGHEDDTAANFYSDCRVGGGDDIMHYWQAGSRFYCQRMVNANQRNRNQEDESNRE